LGNWVRTTPFKGSRRGGSVSFTIGEKAYVGLGYSGDKYLADFYEFDANLGFWKDRAAFPGVPRERAVSFSMNGKGYVGLGYNRDEDNEELADFWEYDPAANEWTQLNNFGGTARFNAIGFAVGDKAFVGTGNDGSNYLGDFWEYTPSTDTWQEIISYPGQKREEGLVFVLEGKAYVCGGKNNGLTDTEFWEFDPELKSWTNRRPSSDEDYYDEFVAAVRRYGAIAFTYNGKAYITTGIGSTGIADNSLFEFEPVSRGWDQQTAFEGSARAYGVAFVLSDQIYVGIGQSGSTRFDDFWLFRPYEEYDEED
jgi:N-acetylneuraminic acid mutarotase